MAGFHAGNFSGRPVTAGQNLFPQFDSEWQFIIIEIYASCIGIETGVCGNQ